MGTMRAIERTWLRGDVASSFWEPGSGVRFEAHAPADAPELWTSYLEGLEETYRAHGVANALDLNALWITPTSPIFVVAIGADDQVLAGMRAHGPLFRPEDAHAVGEFESDPVGQRKVRQLITDRIPFGAIEIKGCWVTDDAPRKRLLSNGLARCYIHVMDMLDVQFAFCTAAVHAATRWRTTGGLTVPGLDAVPYPDDRYETTMLWWNRTTIGKFADPDQLALIERESHQLALRHASSPPRPLVPQALGISA
jgi:hypothetical protein